MKFFFSFLSLFMLYLSCLPCSDREECNVMEEVTISSSANHQEHSHTTEACSPFCTCSCCAASAYYSVSAKATVIKIVFQSEEYPLYNMVFNTEVFYSIWQPPKLAA